MTNSTVHSTTTFRVLMSHFCRLFAFDKKTEEHNANSLGALRLFPIAYQDDSTSKYLPDSIVKLTNRTRLVHMTAKRESAGGVEEVEQ